MQISGMLVDVRTGDKDTDFAEAVSAYYDDALRLAWLLTSDRDRAEDAVGEALAKCLRRWRRQEVRDPRAYIRRAVVNEVNSGWRRLIREREGQQRRHGDDRGPPEPDQQVADRDVVAAALRNLPPRQRAAVVLYYYEGLPQQEVADVLGSSVGTVKSNVSRGLDNLREQLEGQVSTP